MPQCARCGKRFLWGGVRDHGVRFCTEACHEKGYALVLAKEVPDELAARRVNDITHGPCPICGGNGPVDVHTSYRVYSLILFTSWQSVPAICCRSCGRKRQAGSLLFSLLFGWWGFPMGLVMTPVQVLRNLKAMLTGGGQRSSSDQLEMFVRIQLAEEYLEKQQGVEARRVGA